MIRSFHIDNFKSLVGFSLPPSPARLGKFTCLIGLNGAGKSTVLQAFDFIKQLVYGRMDDWLALREWEKPDLASHFSRKQVIGFRIGFSFPEYETVEWSGRFNPRLLRCTSEQIAVNGSEILRFDDGIASFVEGKESNERIQTQDVSFQGSVLSVLALKRAHPAIQAIKAFLPGLKSLDMLAPNLLRKRAREGEDVGYGGERLSAFLHGFSKSDKERLLAAIKRFYPQVSGLETSSLRAGWKNLNVSEEYEIHTFSVTARHLNDGMLRILAIVSQTEGKQYHPAFKDLNKQIQTDPEFKKLLLGSGLNLPLEYHTLLFDEIENGIHPELIEKLVAYLLDAQQQIIVTTHSPMILNYLPDEIAREAVILLYRTAEGTTRSVRYFDLPSTKKKLKLLGPGEVFVDTGVTTLIREAETLRNTPA